MLNRAKWLIKEGKLRIRYMTNTDCIFCKIVSGEIKTDVVAQNDSAIAFNDINPVSDVHIVVIPKKHIDSVLTIEQVDSDEIIAMHNLVKDLVKEKDLSGFRLAYNGGKYQHVPHLHMHLLSGPKVEWKKL